MTLIVALTSSESIWLMADRRLSGDTRRARDNAVKVMVLETTDGVALLGYAGLGETVNGRAEPSSWMSNVLRGVDLPLENSLGILADAVRREVPPHMAKNGTHSVAIPAFIGDDQRFYGIDVGDDGNAFRWTRYTRRPRTERPAPMMLRGTGAALLLKDERFWVRALLRLLRDCNKKKASPLLVADKLSCMNYSVYKQMGDGGTVGPNSIVLWRFRRGGVHQGGGGYQFYSGNIRQTGEDVTIPTIACGMDVNAIIATFMPHVLPYSKAVLDSLKAGTRPPKFVLDKATIDGELAKLPDKPDDRLR